MITTIHYMVKCMTINFLDVICYSCYFYIIFTNFIEKPCFFEFFYYIKTFDNKKNVQN